MKKMRIAVWHNLPSGGAKRQLYLHIKGLLQRGHYVESWCPDSADQNFLPLSSLVTEHIFSIRKRRRMMSRFMPLRDVRDTIAIMNEHARKCADQINNSNFDMLFAGSCLFFRVPSIGRFIRIPKALYLGEPNRILYEAMPELPWIAPPKLGIGKSESLEAFRIHTIHRIHLNAIRAQARFELENAREFDRILVNSLYSRESVLRTYNLESKVCYLGIDEHYHKATNEKKENFIIGVGSFHRVKGIDRSIKAVAAMSNIHRPPLIWVGNTASSYVMSSMKKLAHSHQVTFIPKINIPEKELISLLSRARAMIYTSRLEPFGLAPLEANACGTAVVAIAEGGVRETIRDGINGLLVPDDNPQILAEQLTRFIDDPTLAYTMGQTAREEVLERWNFEKCTDNIEMQLLSMCKMK